MQKEVNYIKCPTIQNVEMVHNKKINVHQLRVIHEVPITL